MRNKAAWAVVLGLVLLRFVAQASAKPPQTSAVPAPSASSSWFDPFDPAPSPSPSPAPVAAVIHDCQAVRSFPVAVGKPSTPTPKGTFYLDALYRLPPASFVGPFAYTLSGHSNVLFSFDGGEGRLGLHGTSDPSSIGHATSHGCVRMFNKDISWLVSRLPLGTPVVVR